MTSDKQGEQHTLPNHVMKKFLVLFERGPRLFKLRDKQIYTKRAIAI